MRPDGVFYVWEVSGQLRGWSYRESADAENQLCSFSIGGGFGENESDREFFARMNSVDEFSDCFSCDPSVSVAVDDLPEGWRMAAPAEIELLRSLPEFQAYLVDGSF